MYVSNRGVSYLVLNERDDLRTFWKIISLYLCKSRFFENSTPSQKKIHKNLSSHFYKGIHRWFYALKNKLPHFLCRKISTPTTAKQKTSSLSLPIHQSIYARKNISPYFFCRSSGSLHTCDERFFNTPSLLQRNSKALLPPKFLTFYKLFTNEEETPLTFSADSETLWANKYFSFFTLFTGKEKSPSLYMGLQKHFDHLKIVLFTNCLIRTHTRLNEGSLENFRIQTISKNKTVGSYKKSD